MQDVYNAEDGNLARTAAKQFADAYGAKFPKAVVKVIDDLDVLLEFYNFPAEHWVHLRTTSPIESLNARYRRAIRARRHFPTELAALECLSW